VDASSPSRSASQYTLHRTQAASYFDEDAFAALTDALTAFGQHELGCRAISPPWLSFYVDGCEQRLHADVPQATARTTLPEARQLPASSAQRSSAQEVLTEVLTH